MTLTEEQLAALKRVIAYMNRMYGIASPYYGCTEDANILRAMIDSSGTVEPTGGFDLERARGLRDFLQDDCAEVGDVWGEMIAEIERLRASLIDLHAEYINTLEKNPECSAWDLDEQSDADQRRLRRNAAHAISIVEPPIYLKAEQQLAKIKELETAYLKAQNSNLLRKQEIERLRPFEIAARDLDSDLTKIAGERDDQAARIKELEDAHKRSGAKYAKIINELRSSVYANIPGLDVGKIGPDAKPRVWQITEEEKRALSIILEYISYDADDDIEICSHAAVLRAMLEEAE